MSRTADFLLRLVLGWALCTALLATSAKSAPPNTIGGSAAVCDPWSPQNCAKPDSSGNMPVTTEALPTGGTMVSASSGNVANASAAATMPAVADKTNYLSGFQLTSAGATAAACVDATVTGLLGGTKTYTYCAPAGAAVGANPLQVDFYPPVPASAVNTAITVTLPALGAGNTNATANIQGYVK